MLYSLHFLGINIRNPPGLPPPGGNFNPMMAPQMFGPPNPPRVPLFNNGQAPGGPGPVGFYLVPGGAINIGPAPAPGGPINNGPHGGQINNGPPGLPGPPGFPVNNAPGGAMYNGPAPAGPAPIMNNIPGGGLMTVKTVKMIRPLMNIPPALLQFENFRMIDPNLSFSINSKRYTIISSVCFDQNPGGNCFCVTKREDEKWSCCSSVRHHFFRIQELNTWKYRLLRILSSKSNEESNMFRNGIKIMENLQGNPSVLTMIDWEMHEELETTVFFIVMEDVPLIFDGFMILNEDAGLKNFKLLWKKMLEAVKNVHSEGVILSFLHPCSFAIANGKFKIGIFDCATMIDSKIEEQNVVLKFIGSEVLEETRISFKTDVAMLAYTMRLFISVAVEKNEEIVGNSELKDHMKSQSEQINDILSPNCLLKNHSERPTIDQLLKNKNLEEFPKGSDHELDEECLEKDVKKAFDQGLEDTDMVLVSDTGHEIPCHKFILSSRSSVFKAMFGMKDSLEATSGRIDIPENTESLQALLKYLYTDSIPKLTDNGSIFQDLLDLAEKYDLGKLKQMCSELLVKIVDESNCIQLYILGYLHNRDDIKMAAFSILKKSLQSKSFKESNELMELMQKHPKIAVEIMSKLPN